MPANPAWMKPSPALLCTLGSIVCHVQEGLGPAGRPVDLDATRALIDSPEVIAWLAEMDKHGLLPVRR